MASKRDFKKYVEAVGSSACGAMVEAYGMYEKADRQAIADSIKKTISAVENARDHSNIYFDKGYRAFPDKKAYSKAKKDFFKKLFAKVNSDFKKELNAALKTFNGALPKEALEDNKAAAAE